MADLREEVVSHGVTPSSRPSTWTGSAVSNPHLADRRVEVVAAGVADDDDWAPIERPDEIAMAEVDKAKSKKFSRVDKVWPAKAVKVESAAQVARAAAARAAAPKKVERRRPSRPRVHRRRGELHAGRLYLGFHRPSSRPLLAVPPACPSPTRPQWGTHAAEPQLDPSTSYFVARVARRLDVPDRGHHARHARGELGRLARLRIDVQVRRRQQVVPGRPPRSCSVI